VRLERAAVSKTSIGRGQRFMVSWFDLLSALNPGLEAHRKAQWSQRPRREELNLRHNLALGSVLVRRDKPAGCSE
jgi:hypothetical protein